jgi:hypothetical protein
VAQRLAHREVLFETDPNASADQQPPIPYPSLFQNQIAHNGYANLGLVTLRKVYPLQPG